MSTLTPSSPLLRAAHICQHCGRPRHLEAFGGEGGSGEGYRRAGLCVSVVEKNQNRLAKFPTDCPGAWRIRNDAVAVIAKYGHTFASIGASPTCTGYSQGTVAIPNRVAKYDRLIGATREALLIAGRPYVLENVYGARRELVNPIMLCGRMFDLTAVDEDGTKLTLDRHRMFETNFPLMVPEHIPHGWKYNRDHGIQVAGAYGGARRDKTEAREIRKGGYVPSLKVMRELLGTPWMTETGCKLSIPPAYTEFIGSQLVEHLRRAAA